MTDAPKPAEMNELARALQYIPHVDKITFEELHAPAVELQEFFYGMKNAMHVKKLIHKLRQRINERKAEQGSKLNDHDLERHPRIHVPDVNDQGQAYDWSKAGAFLRSGTKLPVTMATGKLAVRSPSIEHSSEQPIAYKEHYFFNFFAFALSLDLSGFKNLILNFRRRYPSVMTSDHCKSDASQGKSKKLDSHDQRRNFSSVVFEAMADHEKRMQTLDMFMWLSIILVGCVIFSHALLEK